MDQARKGTAMSQRNPMNDRYTTDERRGQTRKSAAAAKPKTKAASSVHIQSTQKTKQQKKAEQKSKRAQQSELDRKYYNPPTQEYKRLRRIWWILLGSAIAAVALSWGFRMWFPDNETLYMITLGAAYLLIIAAFYVDFSKIRKVRRKYQEQMAATKSKEMRAAEKQKKAAEREAKNAPPPPAPEPKGFSKALGSLRKKAEPALAEKSVHEAVELKDAKDVAAAEKAQPADAVDAKADEPATGTNTEGK